MHVENLSRGGNDIPVCWHNACHHNLHGVWDTSIPHAICGLDAAPPPSPAEERAAALAWAVRLRASLGAGDGGAAEEAPPLLLGAECARVAEPDACALGWARESNAFVCSHVLERGVEWFRGRDLAGEYYERAAPVVEYLVGKAGVRLAAWLEAMVAAARLGEAVFEDGQRVLDNEDL
jgi:hypothetical protein